MLRLSASLTLISLVVTAAHATNGLVGISPVAAMTMKESILFALDRDPSVSQQAAQLGIGQAQIDEARSGWMPQIALNGRVTARPPIRAARCEIPQPGG